jgi:phosphate transport system substrate-binding protein
LALKNQAALQSVELHPPVRYAIIVNKENPVAKLTKEQLAAIFTGKSQNWKEFGGSDQPIVVIWSSLTPGTNALFVKKILDGAVPTKDVMDVKSVADIRNTIASLPEGIGIVAENNIDATIKKVQSPEFKSSPIILITVGKPSPNVQRLVDFIKGDGKKLISN